MNRNYFLKTLLKCSISITLIGCATAGMIFEKEGDAFAAAPEKYAPRYGGYSAFGTANGYKAATDSAAYTIVGDKQYLNYIREVQNMWSADVVGFGSKADHHWPAASKQSKVQEQGS